MSYRYTELKSELLLQIAMGAYPDGAVLPSERDLARMYRISRVSVRRALDSLSGEGVLEKAPNSRTCVRSLPVRPGSLQFVFIAERPLHNIPELYRKFYEAFRLKCALLGYQLRYCDLSDEQASCIKTFDAGFYAGSRREMPPLPFELGRLIRLECIADSPEPVVTTDNFAGGFMAAEYLKECGCRRAAAFFPDELSENRAFQSRIAGFCRGCLETGMECRQIISPNSTFRSVFATLQGECGLREVDGLFCLYDYLAFNVMCALKALEIKVAKDISLIGFDGFETGTFLLPPLTSIVHPVNQIIDRAIALAVREGECRGEFFIRPSIAIRKSTLPHGQKHRRKI